MIGYLSDIQLWDEAAKTGSWWQMNNRARYDLLFFRQPD